MQVHFQGQEVRVLSDRVKAVTVVLLDSAPGALRSKQPFRSTLTPGTTFTVLN